MRFARINDEIDDSFLFYFIQSYLFVDQIRGSATGSAQLNFGPSHVSKVTIPLPPLPEQRAIAAVLTAMDEELAALRLRVAKLERVKAGLLGELLGGRLRV